MLCNKGSLSDMKGGVSVCEMPSMPILPTLQQIDYMGKKNPQVK